MRGVSGWRRGFRLLLPRFAAERRGTPNHLVVRTEAHGLRARDRDECFLTSHRRSFDLAAVIRSVRVEDPALDVVGERNRKNLLIDAPRQRLGSNRIRDFDPTYEIARHPVAARDVGLRRPGILEPEDTRMLEEAINDRDDLNVFSRNE